MEPPPRPTIRVSISSKVFANSIFLTISWAASLPCTNDGKRIVSQTGYLLLIVVKISLIAAPVDAVTIPIFLGILLIGFLCSRLNSPSLFNFSFNCSKATYKLPTPSSNISST